MKDKIITNTTFPYFLGISALLIALCAACFSVYGIGNLFAGASVAAMIMASSLEVGKLIATTFLYRYWSKTVGLVKTYLTIAVISLMIITSAGIFGFLSAAYQKSSLTYKLNQDKIVATESSKGFYSNQIESASERIRVLNDTRKTQETRLSDALKDPMLTRNPIQLKQIQDQTIKLIDQANEDIKVENNKIEEARTKMQSIDEKVNEMKISGIEKKDIQTFKFLADALGVSLDTVAKWFIISLIFVFDPLAVALILAYNVVIYKKEDQRIYDETTNSTDSKEEELVDTNPQIIEPEVVSEPIIESEIVPETVVEPTVVIEEPKTEIIQLEPEPIVEETITSTTTETTTKTTTNTTPPPEIPAVKEEPIIQEDVVVIDNPKEEEIVNEVKEIPSNKVTDLPADYGDDFFRGMFKK